MKFSLSPQEIPQVCPNDFPRAQVIFHCISLLSAKYRYSIMHSISSTDRFFTDNSMGPVMQLTCEGSGGVN